MPKLGVLWCNIKCSIIISMCHKKVLFWLPIQENVTPIKIDRWIIAIFLNCIIKILFGIFLSINMVIGQSSIIVMNCCRLKTNCLKVMIQSIFKFSFFKVREPQVVMCTCSIILHFNSFLQVLNRFI